MQRKKSREGSDSGALSMLKSSLVGVACSLLSMLVCLLAFSAIAYAQDDPYSLLVILAFSAIYISALIAGFIGAKCAVDKRLLSGVLSGLILVMLLFLVSACLGSTYSSEYTWGAGIAIRGSVIFVSMLGGFIGSHKSNTRGRKRKR